MNPTGLLVVIAMLGNMIEQLQSEVSRLNAELDVARETMAATRPFVGENDDV